ncbi:MAG: hypothetical protein JRG93_20095 [Deltaproteobacteria bacterium]|nr:hypothetical protein [Deltaproteobacteria bacterium]
MMTLVPQTLLRIGLLAALALCLILGDGLHSGASPASAQDVHVSGPLAGAPAVKKLRLWRDMRLHVEPFFAFTVGDEYSRSLIVGGELRFHFLDWFGIGGWGGYSVATPDTNLTKEIQADGLTDNTNRLNLPHNDRFPDQVGRLNWWSGVELHFVPFRGKLAMFQKVFFDADLDFFVGAAFVGVEERANAVGQPFLRDVTYCEIEGNPMDEGCRDSQLARSKRTAIAPSFGIAFNAFFHDFLGIALRWRGIPFKYNTGGTDNNRDNLIDSNDRIRQFNNMFSVGLIFVLPPKIKTTD